MYIYHIILYYVHLLIITNVIQIKSGTIILDFCLDLTRK